MNGKELLKSTLRVTVSLILVTIMLLSSANLVRVKANQASTNLHGNFTDITLELPIIDSVSPSSALVGGSEFTLSVFGSGFVSSSIVQWNGIDHSTTYVSVSQLDVQISAADISKMGIAYLRVVDPQVTDAISAEFPFAVYTFADVPPTHIFWQNIEDFYALGITTGCSTNPMNYCPDNPVTRAAMAVFLLRTKNGADYQPPAATGIFTDLPVAGKEWMQPWVEEFYREGITTGCSADPLQYCPENSVTRASMAVFILKAKYGADYQPPAATGIFADLPVTGKEWMEPWVEQFYREGITTGCGVDPLRYCPEDPVKRQAMAAFIVRAFNIVDPRGVAAEDFGVFPGPVVIGYNVGFHLVDSTYADVASVMVNLYNGTTLLSTNTATPKFFTDLATATVASSPFDVLGTFDYAADGYWVNSGWAGETWTLPTKAEIVVTFKNGLVRTAENTNLTGDTSIFFPGDVVALDFGVYVNDAVNLKGYSVGFGLVDAVASDVSGVVVKLYSGTTMLATATATGLMANFPTATSLSAPFDVLGTFDYSADGNWSFSGWLANKTVLPDKAEITVTFKNGMVKTATSTSLTGDISIFAPVLTKPATDITASDGQMNALTGPDNVGGRTFWVSTAPIIIPDNHLRPAGVFATLDGGALTANTSYSFLVSSVALLTPITPNTTYYYVAWVKVSGVWYPGEVMSFTTLP